MKNYYPGVDPQKVIAEYLKSNCTGGFAVGTCNFNRLMRCFVRAKALVDVETRPYILY